MSTVLRIKRSSAATTQTPSTLKPSELAYAEGTSTYTDAVANSNVASGGKLYYGRGVAATGDATSIDMIGGKYFTDLLDHGHGTLTANSALIIDSASKIDVLNVDNITLNGNTFSSTNSNGDLNFDTSGTGDYIFAGAATHNTNFFKIDDGTTDRFVVDSFSGALDITTPELTNADTVLNIDSTWNEENNVFNGILFNVTNTKSDSASRLLKLSVGGATKFDVDASGNVSLTGNVTFVNATTFGIKDNVANAFLVKEGSNNYIDVTTTNNSEKLTLGNNITSIDNVIEDNTANAFTIKEGSNSYFDITTTNTSELITFGTADVTIDNDLNVNGGDIITSATTFNLINTNASIVNFAGAGETITIGKSGAHTTTLGSKTLVGTQTTQNVFNTTATTVNAFGAAESITIGKSGDYTTTLRSKTLVGTQEIQNVFNTTATTVNAFGAATAINMGTASTTLDLGNIRIKGNTISTDSNAATELIIDPFPDAGDAGGDVIIRGNLQVAGTTTTVNSTEMAVNDPVFTIGDTVTEKTVKTSAAVANPQLLEIDNPSGVVESATITGTNINSSTVVGNIRIEFNTASTPLSGNPSAGADIYLYDGTSFSLLGDFVSKTADTVTIDLASNISTRGDDFYNGKSLSSVGSGTPGAGALATLTLVDTKVFKTTTLTLTNASTNPLSSSVDAETKVTISQASDDNLDRGIQFKYLKSNASKVGFFGYDDSTEYFTFLPDATNNSNLFVGTAGKAQFKTVKLDDGINLGVPYFNASLELTRTVAGNTAASFFKINSGAVDANNDPIMVGSSNAFLTVNASGVPIWSDTLDGGSFW